MMTGKKHLIFPLSLILLFTILSNTSYCQKETEKVKKVYHEISYQPVAFFSYSFIRDFNGKFNIGVKAGLGMTYTATLFTVQPWLYSDPFTLSLNTGMFTRNLFLKQKTDRKFCYEIGFLFGLEFFGDEFLKRFSGYTSLDYNFGKFMIGISVRVSTASIFTKNNFKFPYFDLIPLIVTYKF